MTSQDLFRTGEEKAFFTDIMKHISREEDREGVLSDVQRLQSSCFHRATTGESPRAGKCCTPQLLLNSARVSAGEAEHTLVPTAHGAQGQCNSSPPTQKAHGN